MGFIQELIEVLKNLEFFKVVYEYQQGLHFRGGRLLSVRKRYSPREEEAFKIEEKNVPERWKYALPFLAPAMPEGYRRSFWTGMPLCEERFERTKIHSQGWYVIFPFLDSFITDSIQQRVLNLGDVNMLTAEGENLTLSCKVRYQVERLDLACMAVHDYEQSLNDHILGILVKYALGKPKDFWINTKNISGLEREVRDKLRPLVTGKWGLRIHEFYINEVALTQVHKLYGASADRIPLIPTATVPPASLEQIIG
ncbi:MAG: SPFH domain-containing protein [Nanoarchaeota archaeon]